LEKERSDHVDLFVWDQYAEKHNCT